MGERPPALRDVKVGDALVVRLRVREIGHDGAIWCDSPFRKVSGNYAAIYPEPEIVAVESAGRAALENTDEQ